MQQPEISIHPLIGRLPCKEGPGDTEKPVIVKSQVPPALLGKGPASAWTMYQK